MNEHPFRTPEEKIALEIEKLRCEIDELKRPQWARPLVLISSATAIAALMGFIVQVVLSGHEYKRAEIRAMQAQLDLKDAEAKLKQVKEMRDKYNEEVEALKKTARALQARAEEIQKQGESIQQHLTAGQDSAALKDQLSLLRTQQSTLRDDVERISQLPLFR